VALSQSVRYMDEYPQVDAVAGMHVRYQDASMLARVDGGKKIVGPDEYLKAKPVPIASEWSDGVWSRNGWPNEAIISPWNFTNGSHSACTIASCMWTNPGRYHVDGKDRVSVSLNGRRLDDYMKFIEEHDDYLKSIDAPFLSELLFNMWLELLRAGRSADRSGWKSISR